MEKGGYANDIGFICTLIEHDWGSSGRWPLGIICIQKEEEERVATYTTLSVCLYIKS